MLNQSVESVAPLARRDVARLAVAAIALIVILTTILGVDVFPQPLSVEVGGVATADIVAPRPLEFISKVRTEALQDAARKEVDQQYDFTTARGIQVAKDQLAALDQRVAPIDRAFEETTPEEERTALLQSALEGIPAEIKITLLGLTPEQWAAVRAEASRVLDATETTELRESEVEDARARLSVQMAGGLTDDQRTLAATIIAPLIVPNSFFSRALTDQAEEQAAAQVEPQTVNVALNEAIVRRGDKITPEQLEVIDQYGLREARPDVARLGGWLFLSILVVALGLAWIWRFRREVWHRTNALLLISLIVVGTAILLKATAGRPGLSFVVPTAAAGMLLAILLDAGVAMIVTVVIAVLGGAMAQTGSQLEFATYILVGGLAGIIAIRRGDRLQVFVQAGLAVAVANVLVVSTFALLGFHDTRGLLELIGASIASAAGSAVAAVGTFAVLGNLFGIMTVFQLLELANPSQPLLRRLLVETPGTYHHSLMVGNLAERAAEAIGADPLLTRVAAYYHDIGKLANPLAFIENQAGGENIHDQLEPEVSAQILKQHVADGIDIAYQSKLPKALIAFIPQHHGTAIMSYFFARAREAAAALYGGPQTQEGAQAAAKVDERKFRHAGPKPQSREAALIMLADGVEASVRSLSSRDEAAIRAMVARIIEERLADGQFDECDLTLRDIERIREAFVGQLLGMYHQRVAYPQNKVVELESRRGAGTGTGA
ncbi:MAG TPA: HDIG domain-containing protein [Candidatus Limnocylindrales bacterium]|nr:HDIG domain-containing protein [Candidatus Limnocylindrales bacterium]